MRGTLVLLGKLSCEPSRLDLLAREFGWSFLNAASLDHLRTVNEDRNVVAVLFEARTLGISWNEALRSVLEAAPGALAVPCQRFSDAVPWPELATAGAFHSLTLPFNATETRQSLGFVWAARRQRSRKVITLHRRAAPRPPKLLAYGYAARSGSSPVSPDRAE